MGDSGWLGVISAPASFTALKVVPGGVFGGRLSTIRLVWFTTSKVAIEIAATIIAITAGFRSTPCILTNVSVSTGFRVVDSSGLVVPSNFAGALSRVGSRRRMTDAGLIILQSYPTSLDRQFWR
jgi:hypothetical protein